jgi:sterol desaturase/sphingolipid hydroxylase (fatty acid hydroxylase superfamily)
MSTSTVVPPPPPPPSPSQPPPPTQAAPGLNQRSWRRVAGVALRCGFAAVAIAVSFAIDGGIFGAVAALFALVVPFEKLYPRQRGQRLRRPLMSTDVGFALMSPLLNVVGLVALIAIGGLSLFWVPGLLLRPLVAQVPAVLLPFVAFVMFDFLAYWAHRWAHEVPLLWRFHAVHHSPEHMDWVSGFRVHPFDGVLIAPPVFFLLGAGVDGEVAGLLALLQIATGIFFHANVRVRWRWLDKVLANPEFHHWHHANEADAIGHNYAAALPQWDLVFGTYFMPDRTSARRPQHYGIDEYLPRTMIGMLSYPLRGTRRNLASLRHPLRAVRAGARGFRQLLADVGRSTRRKTHSVRRPTAPGCSSTNSSLFERTTEVIEF